MDEVLDSRFVANPHALLTGGVVTDVVYMQNYSSEEIQETLAKYKYEEVVVCSEYGDIIFVGDVRVGSWITSPAPYDSWIFDGVRGLWTPPSDWDGPITQCVPCLEEEHKKSLEEEHKKINNNNNVNAIYSMKEKV